MGLSEQARAALRKNHKKAPGPKTRGHQRQPVLCYIHHLKLSVPLLTLCTHTLCVFLYQYGNHTASLTIIQRDCAHRWLMYSRCGSPFVPDLQKFGRSVDSNKGLLNNRFHSPTQEGPAGPRGVSCSFEHLNPCAASDFPLLLAGGCSFAVFPCAPWLWKGARGASTGSF